jgi:2-polyprenyl-6-methoxyphenol hydroxylase-like FAD-dependent oxidoreductase
MLDYDVVVIGGGVGGTAVGAILSSQGLRILLVEKTNSLVVAVALTRRRVSR